MPAKVVRVWLGAFGVALHLQTGGMCFPLIEHGALFPIFAIHRVHEHAPTRRTALSDALPNVPQGTGFIDRMKGKAKEIVGSLMGNDELVDEGRLHEQKADAEQTAQKEAAAAAQTAAEAELISKERELAAERERLVAEAAEAAERDRLEHERATAHADLERAAATQKAAVERTERAELNAVAVDEVEAIKQQQSIEREADRVENAAEQARRRAAVLEAAQNDEDAGA